MGARPGATPPDRSGASRWLTGLATAVVPAAVTGVLLYHPAGLGERLLGSGGHYFWLHVVLLFGFPATAVVLVVLLRGLRSVESWIARVAGFVYACAYGAYDALAGITIAAYTMEAERAGSMEEARAVLDMRQPLSQTGIIGDVAMVGRWTWVVATIATAAALHRAGVRLWALLPLMVSGYLLLEHDHTPPWGWTAYGALTVGTLLVELVPGRGRHRREAGPWQG